MWSASRRTRARSSACTGHHADLRAGTCGTGGRLSFSTDLASAIECSQAVFIVVSTPSRRHYGHADLTYVYAVAQELAANIKTPTVVLTKSTVPVDTGDKVERIIRDSGTDVQFAVVSNPEFRREGAAIGDFKRPDRIVIGADEEWAQAVMKDGDARGKRMALLGLTFKPNTDEMRNAPSIAIVQTVLDAGAEVIACDPEGMEAAAAIMPGVTMTSGTYAAIEGADAVALVPNGMPSARSILLA